MLKQAKFTEEELGKVAELLAVPKAAALAALGNHWWPNRGLGPIPPHDPVIYRLFEVGPGVCVPGFVLTLCSIKLGCSCLWATHQSRHPRESTCDCLKISSYLYLTSLFLSIVWRWYHVDDRL
jgi:hypothetical protein